MKKSANIIGEESTEGVNGTAIESYSFDPELGMKLESTGSKVMVVLSGKGFQKGQGRVLAYAPEKEVPTNTHLIAHAFTQKDWNLLSKIQIPDWLNTKEALIQASSDPILAGENDPDTLSDQDEKNIWDEIIGPLYREENRGELLRVKNVIRKRSHQERRIKEDAWLTTFSDFRKRIEKEIKSLGEGVESAVYRPKGELGNLEVLANDAIKTIENLTKSRVYFVEFDKAEKEHQIPFLDTRVMGFEERHFPY